MIEEQRHNTEAAVNYYAKALSINHALLDVRVNPRILDSKLIDLALLRAYPNEHARESTQFQPTPGSEPRSGSQAYAERRMCSLSFIAPPRQARPRTKGWVVVHILC